jgi:hypothetical protein
VTEALVVDDLHNAQSLAGALLDLLSCPAPLPLQTCILSDVQMEALQAVTLGEQSVVGNLVMEVAAHACVKELNLHEGMVAYLDLGSIRWPQRRR